MIKIIISKMLPKQGGAKKQLEIYSLLQVNMARFKGWDKNSIKKFITAADDDHKIINQKKIKKISSGSHPIDKIQLALKLIGIRSEREYKFIKDRRFRFDLAIPSEHIAIEFEGGIFSQGRHTRGKGFSNDAKKYNLAVMHGWALLRFTPDVCKGENWEFKIAADIQSFINKKESS